MCLCRGNYVDSLACCEKAQSLLAAPSHLTHGCLGIAHQYSGIGSDSDSGSHMDKAVEHFSIAHQLLTDDQYEVGGHV